jgi:hypothetical protein
MTQPILLDVPVRFWKCPSCPTVDRTQRVDVHTQYHNCPALGGAAIPLVEVHDIDDDPRARQILVPSQVGPGNAAVRTERMDGSNDCTVFPQPARAILS